MLRNCEPNNKNPTIISTATISPARRFRGLKSISLGLKIGSSSMLPIIEKPDGKGKAILPAKCSYQRMNTVYGRIRIKRLKTEAASDARDPGCDHPGPLRTVSYTQAGFGKEDYAKPKDRSCLHAHSINNDASIRFLSGVSHCCSLTLLGRIMGYQSPGASAWDRFHHSHSHRGV